MSFSRPFAYNPIPPNPLISGTDQVGNLAIGVDPNLNYAGGVGGVQWWMGPDENLGYVIAQSVPALNQPNPLGIPAGVGFFRSNLLTESSFISTSNYVAGQFFGSGDAASSYLTSNGYWNSWVPTTFSVGYITAGAVSDVFLFDSGVACKFTPSSSGTIVGGYAYLIDNDYPGIPGVNNAMMAVYSNSSTVPLNLRAYSEQESPIGSYSWVHYTSFTESVVGGLTVTSGVPIWIAVWTNTPGIIRGAIDTNGSVGQYSENTTGTFTWSTWGTWNNVALNNYNLSIYLECI